MRSWIACAALFGSSLAFSQGPGKLTFEVASIKASEPSQEGRIAMRMGADAGMLRYNNVSLKDCIRTAYRVKDFQVEGPDWIGSARFDITAKLPEGASQDQIPEMLQALLADRFKLQIHRETKDHAIYALVVGKGGPKLKPAEVPTGDAPQAGGPGGPGRGGLGRGGMMMTVDDAGAHLKASSVTLASLGELMARFSERPIVDLTGIQGQYDFDLVFTPETLRGVPGGGRAVVGPGGGGAGGGGPAPAEGASDRAGSIYDSVQKYGLKLESRKAPMELIVVDHLEPKPTEN